eukprot:12797-Heterococcus_DN1.PRE.1
MLLCAVRCNVCFDMVHGLEWVVNQLGASACWTIPSRSRLWTMCKLTKLASICAASGIRGTTSPHSASKAHVHARTLLSWLHFIAACQFRPARLIAILPQRFAIQSICSSIPDPAALC